MLELRSLSRDWQDFALREVDLRMETNEYLVLLGPSGAGKSLLLELIAGFHRPDSGSIHLDGREITDLPPERRGIGFVYQDSMLFPHRTVRGNIAYGLRGLDRSRTDETVESLAAMLRISALLERRPATLSGGEKQRVSIARALAVRPRLLLMDEPLAALDPPIQKVLRDELRAVHRETGVGVLHVTHNRAEARELGQRVGILREGRLLQVGEPDEVFERPRSDFVARFTGCANIYEGRASLQDGVTVFRSEGAQLVATAPLSGAVRAVIRPENILVSTEPVRTSARNQLRGRISEIVQEGRVYAVTGIFEGLRVTAVVTGQALEELALGAGSEVYFSFKASSLHLISAGSEHHD